VTKTKDETVNGSPAGTEDRGWKRRFETSMYCSPSIVVHSVLGSDGSAITRSATTSPGREIAASEMAAA
jgi:hypothetical protein